MNKELEKIGGLKYEGITFTYSDGTMSHFISDHRFYSDSRAKKLITERESLLDESVKYRKALEEMAQHIEQFTQAGVRVPTLIAFVKNLKRILKQALEDER